MSRITSALALVTLVAFAPAAWAQEDRLTLEHPSSASARDAVPLGDLALLEDFHPETDRWTPRNNRIRLTSWTGAWLFATDLDVRNDVVTGLRIAWEVPGFIGIRFDSGFVGWSRAEFEGGGIDRTARGYIHAHTLSLGIFNPELSISGLAFWAGFGGGLFVYDYEEPEDLEGIELDGDEEYEDVSLSGNIFVELDYEVADVFHVGVGLRQHFLVGDNSGGVSEITLNLSVLF